ncbi:hypothetical protein MPER_13317, partial [Moniliophthora perniciosa FA553]
MRMRMAHRFVEWDGWEEGLAESMLGSEEFEEDWVKEGVCEEETGVLSPSLDSSNAPVLTVDDVAAIVAAPANGAKPRPGEGGGGGGG